MLLYISSLNKFVVEHWYHVKLQVTGNGFRQGLNPGSENWWIRTPTKTVA